LHRLLRRQLLRQFGSVEAVPPSLAGLLAAVDEAYEQADVDRRLVERSLDLTSQELLQSNAELRRDIAARERVEEALRGSQARMRAILGALPDLVFLVDRDGRIIDFHAAPTAVTYVPKERIIGYRIDDALPPDVAEACARNVRRALESGELQTWEYELPADHDTHHFEARAMPCGADTAVAVVRDVTIVRRMQQRLVIADRLAAVGTLAAGVAHEVNNPLTYVVANLDLLREGIDALGRGASDVDLHETAQLLAEARAGAGRVARVVQDLRSFSRIDPERVEPVDVNAVIESTVNVASHEIRHRARIVKDLGTVPPALGDDSRIGQVALNLLVNAAQALPPGAAHAHEIRVRTWALDGGVYIEVRDTGVGIAPDVLPHIFEPFFTTKPRGVGTGLGLSISRDLVRSMGGEITAESTPGRGTTFRVRLIESEGQVRGDESQVRGSGAPLPARVLVIDDEPLLGRAVARVLRGCDVTIAGSGNDGLAALQQGPAYDVVLCDLMMPEMSGMELYDEVVARRPDLAARFVFITGGTFSEWAREFLARVPNECIEKPFDAEHLRGVVRRQVQRRHEHGAEGGRPGKEDPTRA
jgi:PAS domain S-box-containing protein